MNITGNLNLKSLTRTQSYEALKKKHFDTKAKSRERVTKHPELRQLDLTIKSDDKNRAKSHLRFVEYRINKYNEKPSQKRNPSRRFKSVGDFVEKRQSRGKLNPDFHGIEFMGIAQLGDYETWNNVCELFKSHGVSRYKVSSKINEAFKEYVDYFNNTLKNANLIISEAYSNVSEEGAPHMHFRVLNFNEQKLGLPDTNLSAALRKVYETEEDDRRLTNVELMSRLRAEMDNKLVEFSDKVLSKLAKDNGFKFNLDFYRKDSKVVGVAHDVFKAEKKELEREKLANSLNLGLKEGSLKQKEKNLNEKEKSLDDRELKLNKRQSDVDKDKNKNTEKEKELDGRESNIKLREAQLKSDVEERVDARKKELEEEYDERNKALEEEREGVKKLFNEVKEYKESLNPENRLKFVLEYIQASYEAFSKNGKQTFINYANLALSKTDEELKRLKKSMLNLVSPQRNTEAKPIPINKAKTEEDDYEL